MADEPYVSLSKCFNLPRQCADQGKDPNDIPEWAKVKVAETFRAMAIRREADRQGTNTPILPPHLAEPAKGLAPPPRPTSSKPKPTPTNFNEHMVRMKERRAQISTKAGMLEFLRDLEPSNTPLDMDVYRSLVHGTSFVHKGKTLNMPEWIMEEKKEANEQDKREKAMRDAGLGFDSPYTAVVVTIDRPPSGRCITDEPDYLKRELEKNIFAYVNGQWPCLGQSPPFTRCVQN
jgi:hypothetical protein